MRSRFRKAVLFGVTTFSLLASSIPVYASETAMTQENTETATSWGDKAWEMTKGAGAAIVEGVKDTVSTIIDAGGTAVDVIGNTAGNAVDTIGKAYDIATSDASVKEKVAGVAAAGAIGYLKNNAETNTKVKDFNDRTVTRYSTKSSATGSTASSTAATVESTESTLEGDSSAKELQVQGTAELVGILKNVCTESTDEALNIKAGVVADIIVSLRGYGFSDSAILGVLYNIYHECKFNVYIMQGMTKDENGLACYDMNSGYLLIDGSAPNVSADQLQSAYATRKYTVKYNEAKSYDSGLGMCQWTRERKIKLLAIGNKFSSDPKTCVWDVTGTTTSWAISSADLGEFYNWSKYQPGTTEGRSFSITYVEVPSASMQSAFLANSVSSPRAEENMNDLGDKGWTVGASSYEAYDKQGGSQDMEWETFKTLDDPFLAAEAFAMHYERCGDKNRYEESVLEDLVTKMAPLMDVSTGKLLQTSDSYNTVETTVNTITNMAATGYITEDNLASFSQGAELNVDSKLLSNAVRQALSQSDLYSLANWERNVAYDNTDSKIISFGRKLLVAIGIIFEVWSLLIYLAYWFDRLNNFIPIDLLNILTLGKLRIADSDTEATFSLRDNSSRTNVKTVNHRAVLFIAICGLAFGTLIVTGKLFTLLFGVVNFVRNLLK